MASRTRDLESELLGLPSKDRARLALTLISSLEPKADADVDHAWLTEGERRLDELESGNARGVPADTVFDRAHSLLE